MSDYGYGLVNANGIVLFTTTDELELIQAMIDGTYPHTTPTVLTHDQARQVAFELTRVLGKWHWDRMSLDTRGEVDRFIARAWLAVAAHPREWASVSAVGNIIGEVAKQPPSSIIGHGRIYYSENYAVVQRDGETHATLSRLTYGNDGGIGFSAAEKFLSLSDALAALEHHEQNPTRRNPR